MGAANNVESTFKKLACFTGAGRAKLFEAAEYPDCESLVCWLRTDASIRDILPERNDSMVETILLFRIAIGADGTSLDGDDMVSILAEVVLLPFG